MFGLPLFTRPQPSREPFSQETLAKTSRLRGATVTESVCPYCAGGCGQLIWGCAPRFRCRPLSCTYQAFRA